jgi:hypothetical protein
VRYQLGLVNLGGAPLLELDAEELVFTKKARSWHRRLAQLTPADFRDPDAGWVVEAIAAPFVCILEVRDSTPAEVAEEEARREANL